MRSAFLITTAVCASLTLAIACGDDDGDGSKKKTDAGSDAGADGDGGEGGPPPKTYASCSSDGWCWELPRPQGNTLRGVWAKSEKDIWAVGDRGTIIHYDGKGWEGLDSGVAEDLTAIWGPSSSKLWAVGLAGTVLSWDGKAWTKSVLPVGAEAGADASVTTALLDVYGASESDVWAVGEGGAIWHFDGTTWDTKTNPNPQTLRTVFAATTGKAWAAGDGGLLLEWNGTDWAVAVNGGTGFLAIDGTPDGAVVAATGLGGYFVSNASGTWKGEQIPGATTLRSLWLESTSRPWVFGDGGQLFRYDDTAKTWTKLASNTTRAFLSAGGLDTNSVLVAGENGIIMRWDGDARSLISNGSSANRLALGGSGAKDVWAVGDEVLHDQGSGWQVVDPKTPRALYDVAAVGPDDAWAVGTGGTVLHWKGMPAGFEPVEVKSLAWLRGVAVSGTGGWIVGEKGTLFAMINGTSWIATPSNTSADLNDVWITSATDAWAVGANGTLMHWDGTAWAAYPISSEAGPVPTLRAVWGSGEKDVWAVGLNGTVARYDGTLWTVTRSGELYSLNDVWGSSASDVYAVGSDGKVLHFDGASWTEQQTAVGETLNAVWGSSAKNVLIAGEGGALLRKSQ
ncbi:MAG: hypothetical protein IT377_01690 [Polyangiaceae bacterium]|nr:hypothetical protein [Polyangiaceae bacterium]